MFQKSILFARKAFDTVNDIFRFLENIDGQHELYAKTVLSEWEYQKNQPYKIDILTYKKWVYQHIYFNIDKLVGNEANFE